MSNILTGKVAIITGGAGGIGKATAKKFLEEGAKVAIIDISEDALKSAKKDLDSFGEVMTIVADVSKEKDVENYINTVVNKLGTLDILFNNAGIIGKKALIHEQTVENIDNVYKINVRSVFLGTKYALKVMMKNKGGSIINTASVDSFRGTPTQVPYVFSKHAVVGITKTAALEYADYGIRVNSLHPSPVNTNMMRYVEKNSADAVNAKSDFEKMIPLGRYAEPEDIANVALFLASDNSKFITGAQYRVDGGMGAL